MNQQTESMTRAVFTRYLLTLVAMLCAVSCATLTRHREVAGLEVHTLRLEYANAFLIKQGENAFLVDAGHPHNAEKLEEKIREAGTDPANLRAIIITHGHADHAGGASHFQDRYQTPVIAGRGDEELYTEGKMGKLCPTDRTARRRHEKSSASTYPPVLVSTWVDTESAPIDLEPLVGIKGQIMPIPGHTEGSIWVKLGEVAFVGDLLRGEIVGNDATLHFYMCDLEDNHGDISAVLAENPGIQTYFTGHFGPVTREQVSEFVEEWEPGK